MFSLPQTHKPVILSEALSAESKDCFFFLRSDGKPRTSIRLTSSNHLTMPHHTLSPRQYLILATVAICAPLGDTCLSRGMITCRQSSLAHPATLIAAVFTPWVALGIALLIGFFASYLTALSWADLTFVPSSNRIRQRHSSHLRPLLAP